MKEKTYPSEKLDKFMLRFPDGMRDAIRQAAEASGRSMNAEIVHRLQVSLNEEAEGMPTNPLQIIGGLGDGERDYQLEVKNLNAKMDRILKKLEEKNNKE